MNEFIHLHVHTCGSKLDGMCKVTEVVARAKELGQKALAITDHGNMDLLWKFQQECIKQGIKPILGQEFYTDDYIDGERHRGHLVLLAKDNEGLQNLYKLHELSYSEGFYKKPMINQTWLREHAKGIVCLSACLANTICQYIMKGRYIDARKQAVQYKEIFGNDFYLELQANDLMEQFTVNKELVNISKELDIPLVLTNDVHYVYEEDHDVHEVLLAISTNKKMNDKKRWKFPCNGFHLKSEKEMINSVRGVSSDVVEQCISNTAFISSICNAQILPGKYLPKFPFLEEKETSEERLEKEVFDGYTEKFENPNSDYIKALHEEIEVISSEGYADYFLIVQDYIREAREAGILVGDGRGSGGGSKVCYAMDIVRTEPEEFNCIFERFMAKGREPDIDTDFSDIDKVFEAIAPKYGWENVCRIQSFGTFAPRVITRRILSIFDHKPWDINRICKLIPEKPGLKWKDVLENEEYIKEISSMEREWKCIQRLQGNISHTSMHAGGVVIWNKLSDVLPTKCIVNENGDRIKRCVCFDMDDLHELHHFKFDILGLATLETLQGCLDNIKSVHDINLDLQSINYNDSKVYDMLCTGDVTGVFQVEEQRDITMQQQPRSFIDLIALMAIIRPGDYSAYFRRRNGEEEYILHPLQEKYMKETYGIYIYQEQFMLDAGTFAGWDMAYADKYLRKNKHINEDEDTKNKFITDCISKGILSEMESRDMWNAIAEMVSSGYSFNKAHAMNYAKIAYQEAYLKCYYPECFYSALLTKHGDKQEKVGAIISECKSKGIKIIPPDINYSEDTFIPTDRGIAYRLNTIKGVGDTALAEIRRLRPISDFDDLLQRRNKSKLKSNNIEALIKAGCFDYFDTDRQALLYKFDKANCKTKKGLALIEPREYKKTSWEFEVLGLFLTEHPLDKYLVKRIKTFDGNEYNAFTIAYISDMRVFNDKNGNEMAFMQLSNQYEVIKGIAFQGDWKKIKKSCAIGNVCLFKGILQNKDLIINSVEYIEDVI